MKSVYSSQVPYDLMAEKQLEFHRKVAEEFDLIGQDELGELACAILTGGRSLQSHIKKLLLERSSE